MSRAAPAGGRAYGVAVIGGGPAGIAAATAAARCGGGPVLLVERDHSVGGNVAQALVHTICGLYLPSGEKTAEHAHAGLPRAFAGKMLANGSAGAVDWAGNSAFLAIEPDGFTATAEALLAGERIAILLGSRLHDVRPPLSSSEPWQLLLDAAGGERVGVAAWTVIDTTGDANAAAMAGIATEIAAAEDLQHASFIVRVDGVDVAALDAMERARTSAVVARAAKRGELPTGAASVLLRCSPRPGSVFVTMNLAKPAVFDPVGSDALADLQRTARADAEALVDFLIRDRAAFRDARVGAWPGRVGIRETRRIRGLEQLSVDDVLAGRRRDDEACVSTWPVELWTSAARLEFRAVAGPSSIPLGCLVADHPSRRFAMAGRCASASHEALGAIRVIATAMAMGEAAGAACALAAARRGDLGSVDAASVRQAIADASTGPR